MFRCSVFWPALSMVKWTPLVNSSHSHADNSLISISNPQLSPKLQIHVSNCQFDILTWMANKIPKPNMFKTAFLIFSLKPVLFRVFLISLTDNSNLSRYSGKNLKCYPWLLSFFTPHICCDSISSLTVISISSIYLESMNCITFRALVLVQTTIISLKWPHFWYWNSLLPSLSAFVL